MNGKDTVKAVAAGLSCALWLCSACANQPTKKSIRAGAPAAPQLAAAAPIDAASTEPSVREAEPDQHPGAADRVFRLR